jgi:hypothetical protein
LPLPSLPACSDSAGALDGSYSAAPCGNGTRVHVFVIDTGVFAHHELAGRLSNASACMLDATGGCAVGGVPWSDDHGHGTHCSGIVGGTGVGASKSTVVHAVKVLSAAGSGTISAIAAGCNWCVGFCSSAKMAVFCLSFKHACAAQRQHALTPACAALQGA